MWIYGVKGNSDGQWPASCESRRLQMRVANQPASESAPGTHRPAERPLFEPPRIRKRSEGERPTSWLEFFFDLVFVVAIRAPVEIRPGLVCVPRPG